MSEDLTEARRLPDPKTSLKCQSFAFRTSFVKINGRQTTADVKSHLLKLTTSWLARTPDRKVEIDTYMLCLKKERSSLEERSAIHPEVNKNCAIHGVAAKLLPQDFQNRIRTQKYLKHILRQL